MNDKRYNLLIITPDQMRADYLGCYGNTKIGTKHIDGLAKEGVVFQNCYCAAPLCAPSRISFATSTYFSEHNHRNYGSTISPKVPNIAMALKNQGYRAGMFGKNHLFTYEDLDRVWDELDEICLGNCDGHSKYEHSFSSFPMEIDEPYNITKRLTDETIEFMEHAEEPFFAWVNYQDPHPVFACPPPYATLFDPDEAPLPESFYEYDLDGEPVRNQVWREHSEMELCSEADMKKAIAMYMGQVRYVDDNVGRLMDSLKKTGKDKNTIILFFSDHGELLGDHGMTHKIPVFYDSLTKIPTILYHPDEEWEGRVFQGLVEEVDLAPTLLDLLNIQVPQTMIGKSLVTELRNGTDEGKENIICEAGIAAPTQKEAIPNLKLKAPFSPTSYGCGAMVRQGDWKLSIYADDRCQLFHLGSDPSEINNLYGKEEYAKIQSDLTLILLKRILSVKTRDIKTKEWDYEQYGIDVREAPLE